MTTRLAMDTARLRRLVLATGAAILLTGVAGCGGSDDGLGELNVVTTAASSSPTTSTTTGSDTPVDGAATGRAIFIEMCQSCHLAGGTRAGVGPRLAGRDLTAADIRAQIDSGGGGMPADLVAGADLAAIIAYVGSLQTGDDTSDPAGDDDSAEDEREGDDDRGRGRGRGRGGSGDDDGGGGDD